MDKEKSIDLKAAKQLLKSLRRYERASGYKMQPSTKILATIMKGLLKNVQKHGAKYCPCRKPTGDSEKDKKIICPCAYHKDEIKNDGHCKCLLYFRKVK
jgi:ferredoxin-thioredoxin reductase catalytic subunit